MLRMGLETLFRHSSWVLGLVLLATPVSAFHDETVALTCRPCNATEFCHAGLRQKCPSNSRSDPGMLPSEIGDCVCVPGYLREGDLCNLGEAPYWYVEGVRQTCAEFPRRVTVESGAWTAAQCVCVPGYSDEDSEVCVRCPADTFNSLYNHSCEPCPAHSSHTDSARVAVTSCTCDPGYSGPDGGPCEACAGGQFKTVNGSAACETCPPDTFSNGSAAARCTACHGNSTAEAGGVFVADCLCDPGFELVGGLCQQCGVGKFKGHSGNEACELCTTDGEFSGGEGATACEVCHENSHSEGTRERCLCDAGYTQDDLRLLHPTCSPCAVNTYQNVTGQTACVACDAQAQSPEASTALVECVCNAGFFEVGEGACAACAPGTYKDAVDDQVRTCTHCPVHSDSLPASASLAGCLCDAGWEGPLGGPCEACAVGKFKAGNGSAACQPCAANTYADAVNSSLCTSCFAHSIAPEASDDLADCLCDVANGWSEYVNDGERACAQCVPGKYATAEGFETGAGCANCSFGTFTHTFGQTACDFCPANTSSYSSPRVECECDAGYRCPDSQLTCDGVCEACEADTFKVETGYSDSCTACQANAQSPLASTSPSACLCNAGFYHEQARSSPPPYTCTACAPGTYTDVAGEEACVNCPRHYFTAQELHPWDDAADCVACGLCPEHEYDAAREGLGCGLDVPTACAACPAHSGTWHNDTFDARNTNVTACACNAGYYGPLGGPCVLCPAGFVKLERLGRDTTEADCVKCPVDTYMTTQDSPCRDCLAHSSSPAGSFEKQHCACDAGRENVDPEIREAFESVGAQLHSQDLSPDFVGVFEDEGLTVCRRCARGFFKELSGPDLCEPCTQDTFQNSTGMSYCDPCPVNMSSLSAATVCFCDPSFENVHGNHHDCTLCGPGTYKTEFGDQRCTPCSACAEDEQVDLECAPGHNITCKPCQGNSWTPAGRSLQGPCLCNAGYDLHYDGDPDGNPDGYPDGFGCEPCAVGKYKTSDMNNSVMCATCAELTFTTGTATVHCTPCTPLCDDTGDTSTRAFYVASECTPWRDIICSQCTVCAAGYYANSTCGAGVQDDRADTTCALCPADFYCPGNGTSLHACPTHSHSVPGSSSPQACQCAPGYFQVDARTDGTRITDTLGLLSHRCEPCPFDTYCTGDGRVAQCPNHSFTFGILSSHRLDCQCHRGYYRAGADDAFLCPLCTPNDYCFNNSRYNCSDDRMLSDAGSAYFANCTCMAGFYNNGSRCESCPEDSYCVDGLHFACPETEWTNGLRQQAECVCRPGFFSPSLPAASPKSCERCPEDSFCTGQDDTKTNCTRDSTAPSGSSTETDCKCLPGFENATLGGAHVCVGCPAAHAKETVSNEPCQPCTVCKAEQNVYEMQACRADYDARCDACNPCTNGSLYTSQACVDKADAICSPCTKCDYDIEYLDEVCTPQQNAICRNITFDRSCPVGQYAGGHTSRSDSYCQLCSYRDTPYFGQRLHEAASAGLHYDDPYSCQIQCLGFSHMIDISNHSLGCVSCETGNVLLREFQVLPDVSGHAVSCSFECRSGFEYDPVRKDCFSPVLKASPRNFFNHELHISNWERTLQGFLVTVTHTNHSRFVVVAGSTPPTSCRQDECCFRHLWRVSSLAQMGLTAQENCSRSPPLLHATVFGDTLEFEIPDTRLAEVASCAFVANATQECTLVVSLVDTVLLRAVSKTLILRTRRATTYAFFNGAHKYIPLDYFEVDVFLAFREEETDTIVLMVLTQVRSAHAQQNVTLRVPGLSPIEAVCPHMHFENGTQYPPVPSIMADEARLSSFVTFWRGPSSLSVARLFYSLQAGPSNLMDVAAVRNVTQLHPVCVSPQTHKVIQLGFVEGAAGLGSKVIESMHRLHYATSPSSTTRGEMGSLISFVAEAYSPFVTRIVVKAVLAAHLAGVGSSHVMTNATEVVAGVLDFRYEFREWCRSPGSNTHCTYEYLHLDMRGRTMHVLEGCTSSQRNAAQAWLTTTFGVVNDGGHVDALCTRVGNAKHKATAVMVNTLAYVSKNSVWNSHQNFSAPPTVTFAWPNFQFIA